jgi:hypothetical protein
MFFLVEFARDSLAGSAKKPMPGKAKEQRHYELRANWSQQETEGALEVKVGISSNRVALPD